MSDDTPQFRHEWGDRDETVARARATFQKLSSHIEADPDDPIVAYAYVGIHASGAATRNSVAPLHLTYTLLMVMRDYAFALAQNADAVADGIERRN